MSEKINLTHILLIYSQTTVYKIKLKCYNGNMINRGGVLCKTNQKYMLQ